MNPKAFRSMRKNIHPPRMSALSCIVPPTEKMVIRPYLVFLPTFHGSESKNPYSHIREFECSDPRARFDPNGKSEPKSGDARFISFILRVIKFYFSKMSRPESLARPEWWIRTRDRFTLTFSFILSKHFINSFSCGSGFRFGQAHNHLQIQSNSVGP